MNEHVEYVTDGNFEEKVLHSSKPVLVDFFAPWCGPCHVVSPLIEALAEEHKDDLKVVKVNVDESPNVAQQMGIRGIPTLMIFEGGEVKEMAVGAQPKAGLEEMVSKVLTSQN